MSLDEPEWAGSEPSDPKGEHWQTVAPQILTRIFQVLAGILLGLAVALWILRPGSPPPPEDLRGSYFLADPIPAPSFSLASHMGGEVSTVDFAGKLLVVFFGYTSCPDVCPLTLSNLQRAFQEMEEEGERIQVLLITVDPQRDTPARLAHYLGFFHPSFLGLLGTEEELRRVADAFGAFFAKSGEGEQYTVDHTSRVFVVASDGTIPLTFPVTATPREMARDLAILLERNR